MRASEVIDAPVGGASTKVQQPHVVAELIPETTLITAGKPFEVILHLKMDEGWHTYWINPGDAGLATTIRWTLPEGFTAGPIQWPTPEKHNMGPLVTYGYEGDVYLITTITSPATISSGVTPIEIKARADWLVCLEECIPGSAKLAVSASLVSSDTPMISIAGVSNRALFKAARERLPVPNTRWNVDAAYKANLVLEKAVPPQGPTQHDGVLLHFEAKPGAPNAPVGNVRFFPEQANVLGNLEADNPEATVSGTEFSLPIALQQNGETPDKLSGVLVSDQPLIGQAKSVYVSEFSVAPLVAAAGASGGSVVPTDGAPATSSSGTATAPPLGTAAVTSELPGPQPLLLVVLGAAFIGGLILNLMPCVLPVLSLKVFSLMRHAGENPRDAWKQGAAFTAGVVISFWVLAGLLLALKAAGNQLGWGFQMQSPGFVLGLIFLFFLLALNLFGVFELGTSLVGLDAKATGKSSGLASSFFNGALATAAATPCTAPFMGSSLGFAAQQPAFVAMLIFTFLALGMAAPYQLLTIFPGALRFVPKPGAWMESFKQFMGFLLMATVIFLIYVFGALVEDDVVPYLLGCLLLAGCGAWQYGKWGTPVHSGGVRFAGTASALLFMGLAVYYASSLAMMPPPAPESEMHGMEATGGWTKWSPATVDQALAGGKPVFVDFTAAWCLSCKVNERVALSVPSVQKAFADKNVVLLKGDWTHADPTITQALRKYNRDGVPLYLLYSPKDPANPHVFPEVLTPGIVLDAVNRL